MSVLSFRRGSAQGAGPQVAVQLPGRHEAAPRRHLLLLWPQGKPARTWFVITVCDKNVSIMITIMSVFLFVCCCLLEAPVR